MSAQTVDKTYDPGDVVRIGGDSILKGQGATIIADDGGPEVFCCTNGSLVGSDWPIRHTIPREHILPYEESK